jgi:hypothetical protein
MWPRGGRPALVPPPPGVGGAGVGRDAPGHAVQPRPQRAAQGQRPGPAGQDQEGGLEGVLGVVRLAQGRPAGAQHERAVAAHQGGERRLGRRPRAGREAAQQLGVRQGGQRRRTGRAVEVREDRPARVVRHVALRSARS